MTSDPIVLDRSSRVIARLASAIVIVAGLVSLLGWLLDVAVLKAVVPGGLTMKVNTALCFILAGVGLGLVGSGRASRSARVGSKVCSGAILLVGVATMGEYLVDVDLGIDVFLFDDPMSQSFGLPPGRMAFATALNFVLIGLAMLVVRRTAWLAKLLTLPVGLIVAVSLLGFLFDERAIYAFSPYTSLAFHTAVAFAFLCLGMLCVVPGSSPMTVVLSRGEAGRSLRRLLVLAVGATLVLSRVVLEAGRAGHFSLDYGLALSGTLVALVLVVMLWVNGGMAFRVERKRDELEARLVEQRAWYEVTLSSIGDAVIATDFDGRVTFMNPVAEGLTGWPLADAKGRDLMEVFRIIDEEARIPIDDPVRKVLATGLVVGLANHTILIARDGSELPIADSAAPISGEGGRTIGVVLVFRDASSERQAKAALVEADRRKDEFLAMLAHELRNPLAAVNNAVAVVSRSDSAGKHFQWCLSVISRQVHHLSRLIDDLLDVSRITRGKIELKRQTIDVIPIINQAVETVRPIVEDRQHDLVVKTPRALWMDIDPTRLEQILVNLLTNAAKYTEGGGRIKLDVSLDGLEAVITVVDNGMGIAPEKIASMFDLFAQGDRTLARSEGGLGIGLTIVRSLVELHSGRVSASSGGPGQGTSFIVRLPAEVDQGARVPEPSPVQPAPPSRPTRILIVDDNRDTARGMARLLKLLGHEVRTAFDGPTAVEAARTYLPEVIILDIGLPLMDGYQVASLLRGEACGKDTLIIAASGYGNEDDRRRSRESGIDHHLVKPVDYDALIALVGQSAGSS